jgi:hypothetical protein
MLAEPVVKMNCRECKLRTEHIFSKNVKGEVVYMCLRCGHDIAFSLSAIQEAENDLPEDDSLPVGVA